MKRNIFLSLAMTVVILLGMTGCSRTSKFSETIPANVAVIIEVNVNQVLDRAGFEKHNGNLVVPDYLSDNLKDDDGKIMETISRLTRCTDLDNMFIIGVTQKDVVMTFAVTDPVMMREILTENDAEITAKGGYNIVDMGAYLIFTDKQVWIVPNDSKINAVDKVDKLLADARKQSIADLSAVASFLAEDNTINIAGNPLAHIGINGIPAELQEMWTLVGINIEQKEINFNAVTCKADGNPVEFAGLKEINPAVLAYIPGSFNFATAAGFSPEMNWDNIIEAIGSAGGVQARGIMGIISPYLKAIDGTVMIAADIENMNNPQFMAMLHLPQAKVNEALAQIRGLLNSNRIPYTTDDNGMMVINMDNNNFHVGTVDGYLAVSNIPFSPDQQNSLAPVFVNKKGAMSLNLPTLKIMSPAAPVWGISLTVESDGTAGKGKLTLNGTDGDILPTILKTVL